MKPQVTPNSQSNFKEQTWKTHISQFQNILQNQSNQNSMVPAQRQTNRPMKKNREPFLDFHVAPTSFSQKRQVRSFPCFEVL